MLQQPYRMRGVPRALTGPCRLALLESPGEDDGDACLARPPTPGVMQQSADEASVKESCSVPAAAGAGPGEPAMGGAAGAGEAAAAGDPMSSSRSSGTTAGALSLGVEKADPNLRDGATSQTSGSESAAFAAQPRTWAQAPLSSCHLYRISLSVQTCSQLTIGHQWSAIVHAQHSYLGCEKGR